MNVEDTEPFGWRRKNFGYLPRRFFWKRRKCSFDKDYTRCQWKSYWYSHRKQRIHN